MQRDDRSVAAALEHAVCNRGCTGVFPLAHKGRRPQDARVAQAAQLVKDEEAPRTEGRSRKPRPRPGCRMNCVIRFL